MFANKPKVFSSNIAYKYIIFLLPACVFVNIMCAIVLLNFVKFRVVPVMSWVFDIIIRIYIYSYCWGILHIIWEVYTIYMVFFILFNCIVLRNDITYTYYIFICECSYVFPSSWFNVIVIQCVSRTCYFFINPFFFSRARSEYRILETSFGCIRKVSISNSNGFQRLLHIPYRLLSYIYIYIYMSGNNTLILSLGAVQY